MNENQTTKVVLYERKSNVQINAYLQIVISILSQHRLDVIHVLHININMQHNFCYIYSQIECN